MLELANLCLSYSANADLEFMIVYVNVVLILYECRPHFVISWYENSFVASPEYGSFANFVTWFPLTTCTICHYDLLLYL